MSDEPPLPARSGRATMWRYLKAAFWRSPRVAGLGSFPLNAAGVIGILILGFAQPAIWLIGAGLEALYLVLSATSPRFQKAVQANARFALTEAHESRRGRLVSALPPESRVRLQRLEKRCAVLTDDTLEGDAVGSADNRDALQRLTWTFLKLLVAQQHLRSAERETDSVRLAREVETFRADLTRADLQPSLRSSKQATLKILLQRQENAARRQAALEQIETDLTRVEQQVELAIDHQSLKGEPAMVSADVDLASELLEDSFGSASVDVAALDQRYGVSASAPRTPDRLPH